NRRSEVPAGQLLGPYLHLQLVQAVNLGRSHPRNGHLPPDSIQQLSDFAPFSPHIAVFGHEMGQLHVVAPLFEHDLVHLTGHVLLLKRPEGIPLAVLRVLDPDQPQLHSYTSSGRSGRIRYSLVRLLTSRTSRPSPIWCSTHALMDAIPSVRRDLNSTVGLSGSTIRLNPRMFRVVSSCLSMPIHPPGVGLRPAFALSWWVDMWSRCRLSSDPSISPRSQGKA